jgi:hypothetical protein
MIDAHPSVRVGPDRFVPAADDDVQQARDQPRLSLPVSWGSIDLCTYARYVLRNRAWRGRMICIFIMRDYSETSSHRFRRMVTAAFLHVLASIFAPVALVIGPATAMQFRTVWIAEEKTNVIVGEGPIENGDAKRLEEVMPRAGRDRYGNIPIYLNSPGGLVQAAFEMVSVMDREEFSALVGSEAQCASACASILFISARFHLVLGTGLLGIHTCYVTKQGSRAPEPSSFCNEVIAQNAVAHGTSYGAVQMWQRNTAPDEMAWLGQDVACKYGLCGPPGFDEILAVPSFDCKASKLQSEVTICSNKRLARYDASISKYYAQSIKAMPNNEKELFRVEQRAYLKYRDSCQGEENCLLQRMRERLNGVMEKWGKYAVGGVHQ